MKGPASLKASKDKGAELAQKRSRGWAHRSAQSEPETEFRMLQQAAGNMAVQRLLRSGIGGPVLEGRSIPPDQRIGASSTEIERLAREYVNEALSHTELVARLRSQYWSSPEVRRQFLRSYFTQFWLAWNGRVPEPMELESLVDYYDNIVREYEQKVEIERRPKIVYDLVREEAEEWAKIPVEEKARLWEEQQRNRKREREAREVPRSEFVQRTVQELDDKSRYKVLLSIIVNVFRAGIAKQWALELADIYHRQHGNYLLFFFARLRSESPDIADRFIAILEKKTGISVSTYELEWELNRLLAEEARKRFPGVVRLEEYPIYGWKVAIGQIAKPLLEALEIIIHFIPVIGQAVGALEAIIGRELFTGRELEGWERLLEVIPYAGRIIRVGRPAASAILHTARRSGLNPKFVLQVVTNTSSLSSELPHLRRAKKIAEQGGELSADQLKAIEAAHNRLKPLERGEEVVRGMSKRAGAEGVEAPKPAPEPKKLPERVEGAPLEGAARKARLTKAQRDLRAKYIGLIKGVKKRHIQGNIYETQQGFLVGPYDELIHFVSDPSTRRTLALAEEAVDVHHIIEMRHLNRTKGIRGRFTRNSAPGVVLTKEFHRLRPMGEAQAVAGWITSREAELGLRWQKGLPRVNLSSKVVFELYGELYADPSMSDLRTIARRILGLRP